MHERWVTWTCATPVKFHLTDILFGDMSNENPKSWHFATIDTMAAETPPKRRRTEHELQDRNGESPHNEGASSGEVMDVVTSHEAFNVNNNGHQRGKRRGANGVGSAWSDTAKLTQVYYEHNSNVFHMEASEFLAEVKVDYKKRMGPVEKALHKLKSIIDSIPTKEPAMVSGVLISGQRTPKTGLTAGL